MYRCISGGFPTSWWYNIIGFSFHGSTKSALCKAEMFSLTLDTGFKKYMEFCYQSAHRANMRKINQYTYVTLLLLFFADEFTRDPSTFGPLEEGDGDELPIEPISDIPINEINRLMFDPLNDN